MIEKQREKEFLFELEQLYLRYNLVVTCDECADLEIEDATCSGSDRTIHYIKAHIDELRVETKDDS